MTAAVHQENETPEKVAVTTGAKVWINGRLADESEAHISPFDHGLLTGDGVFETLIAYTGKPFAMTLHWERLVRSAAVFGLEVPDKDSLETACEEVIMANGVLPARLRITITGGYAPLGSEKGNSGQTIVIAAGAPPNHPDQADVVTVPYPRNERGATVGLKTISYGENVIALAYAKANGGSEAIFGNTQGHLCEGTGSNIFIVQAGRLITPPLNSGCLAGCTRHIVLDLCKQQGIEVSEDNTPLDQLENVDEAFLTSTLREVKPISSVDGKALKTVNGEITQRIARAFREFAQAGEG